jgi:hypothetical protein
MRDTFSAHRFDARSSFFCVTTRVKTAWERLLVSFMFVAATVRALLPSSMRCSTSAKVATAKRLRSST